MNKRYRVIKTGEVGELSPSPSNNPIIIIFKDGVIDVFFTKELEETTEPLTNSTTNRHALAKRGRQWRGRPKGPSNDKKDKMTKIIHFLMEQNKPIRRVTIENVLGFNCVGSLMYQPSQKTFTTLESLKIVEWTILEKSWKSWKLTELGRKEGLQIIEDL